MHTARTLLEFLRSGLERFRAAAHPHEVRRVAVWRRTAATDCVVLSRRHLLRVDQSWIDHCLINTYRTSREYSMPARGEGSRESGGYFMVSNEKRYRKNWDLHNKRLEMAIKNMQCLVWSMRL